MKVSTNCSMSINPLILIAVFAAPGFINASPPRAPRDTCPVSARFFFSYPRLD